MRPKDTDTYPVATYPDGVVLEERDGNGPSYLVYDRTDGGSHFAVDKLTFPENGMIVYGKLVLFDTVKVELTTKGSDVLATVKLDSGGDGS